MFGPIDFAYWPMISYLQLFHFIDDWSLTKHGSDKSGVEGASYGVMLFYISIL